MEKYLTKDLGVPSNRIQLLLGSKKNLSPEDPTYPSRAHIVGTPSQSHYQLQYRVRQQHHHLLLWIRLILPVPHGGR